MLTLVCEDSIDGIFSAIYEVWNGRHNRDEIFLKAGSIGNYELFMEYQNVAVCPVHVQKVASTIRRRFGEETYETICYALWSNAEDKADVVYQMVRYGIEHKFGRGLQHHLTNPSIERVFELSRGTSCEAHQYLGFIRFRKLENGIFYAPIQAKNYVLEAVATHFADRIPAENWVIHDTGYRRMAVHPSDCDWMVIDEAYAEELLRTRDAWGEEDIRQLWKNFCSSISIEARENRELQRQNLPYRYRRNMV